MPFPRPPQPIWPTCRRSLLAAVLSSAAIVLDDADLAAASILQEYEARIGALERLVGIAGQQIASVLVDRYGWLRLPQRPVSATRLIGVAILLLGVAIVRLM